MRNYKLDIMVGEAFYATIKVLLPNPCTEEILEAVILGKLPQLKRNEYTIRF